MKKRGSKKTAAPLGQHLLTNTKVAERVASEAGVTTGVRVLEIGPGKGILTAELLKLGGIVTAVEKDPQMIVALNERFQKEIADKQLTILSGDARTITPDDVFPRGAYVVAANIPYYITGELLRTCLTAKNQPSAVSFLVQKEVAERVARSKKESILSLSVKAYGTPKYVTTVKAGNFNPPPRVDSAILAITNVSRKNFKHVDEQKFFALVKAGFGQKRKTLAGNVRRALNVELDIDQKIRAEDVALDTWLELAKKI
ncbi:MAG: dimethyladenosine transferase, rRNA (adenine1518-N6/adenine1519-N6)-dimethyltransferase [Candidatus Parcubacteria bacterium]|jgi:16S rRNA (adenine1518-N6/adenine1519-N6)-dimethyltransferase